MIDVDKLDVGSVFINERGNHAIVINAWQFPPSKSFEHFHVVCPEDEYDSYLNNFELSVQEYSAEEISKLEIVRY